MVDIFSLFNPLHPNISMHILHTFIYTFLKVLTRRICLAIVATPYSKYSLFSHGVAMVSCRKHVKVVYA